MARYDLGSGSTTLKIPSGVKLNQLHRASAVRHGRDGLLKLDDELKDAGLSPGQIRSLDLGLPIYLGSVPDKSTMLVLGITCVVNIPNSLKYSTVNKETAMLGKVSMVASTF